MLAFVRSNWKKGNEQFISLITVEMNWASHGKVECFTGPFITRQDK
jgi:hypothetical protein